MADKPELTELIRFTVGLAADRGGRIQAEPPPREEAAAKLAAWRASREQSELDEIEALEAALKKESPA